MIDTLTKRFVGAHPEDAARVLESLDVATLAQLVEQLPADAAAQVLRRMPTQMVSGCLRALDTKHAAALVEQLPSATSASALRQLDPDTRRDLMRSLSSTVSVPLRLALRYPKGTVGALLDPRAASVRPELTVGQPVQAARRTPDLVRRYVYVVDDQQQLAGVLDVRACLVAPRSALVRSLMRPGPAFLRARTALAEARAHPAWARLDVLPVVDRPETFVGVIRRRALEAAGEDEERAAGQERGLTATVIDLANLYWQTSTSMFLGERREPNDER